MSTWIALSLWSLVQIAFRFAETDNKNENEMKLVNGFNLHALTFCKMTLGMHNIFNRFISETRNEVKVSF